MRDLFSQILVKRGFDPVVLTNADTAQVSAIIDTQGFEALMFVIATGVLTDANATFTALLEHGEVANLSDAAAVPANTVLGSAVAASFQFGDDQQVRKIGYRCSTGKRYVRLTVTPSGNDSGAAPLACVALLGRSARTPTLTQADA